MMKVNLTGYRTYIASVLVAVFGALAAVDWLGFLNHPTITGGTMIAVGILMAVMRSVTNTPPGQPSSPVIEDDSQPPKENSK